MKMILERFCYSDMGTFGRLTVNNFECFTVEQPWNNNEPFKSCVPEGPYLVKRTSTPNHAKTFILINEDLDVYEFKQGKGRYAILIHIGNTIDDVVGCIAPGKRLGYLNQKWAVFDSRDAYRELDMKLGETDELVITHYKVKYGL